MGYYNLQNYDEMVKEEDPRRARDGRGTSSSL